MAKQNPTKCQRAKRWIKSHIYLALYILLLLALSAYIILHWNECISMQFFSKFDGNNILFLVWIVLLVLPFYVVEGGGFRFHMRGLDEMSEKIQDARATYEKEKAELNSQAKKQNGGDQVS